MTSEPAGEVRADPPARRTRRLLRAVVAVVVASLLLLAAGTWLNSRAFGELLTAVEAGETVLEDFNTQGEALVRSQPDEDAARAYQQSAFWTTASALAEDALQGLIVERQRVKDVRLWPWDSDAKRARARYLDHLAAWERQLRGYARREQANEGPAIEATFILVNDALTDAVPLLSGDYRERVEAIGAD